MKKSIIVLLVVFSTMNCFGQSLFFDNANNSTWESMSYYNDSTIRVSSQIFLEQRRNPLDSLKSDITTWTFKDGSLTIKYYNYILKQTSLIVTYKYQVNRDKRILEIILNDNKKLKYEVGTLLPGRNAILTKLK